MIELVTFFYFFSLVIDLVKKNLVIQIGH